MRESRSDAQEWGMEDKENKKEIIDNAEEARRQFRDFWKKDNSSEALGEEVEECEIEKYKEFFWTYYSSRNQRKRNKKYKPNELIFISGNPNKQNQLLEIAKKRGIKVLSQDKIGDGAENAIHANLKKLIAEDEERTGSDKKGYSRKSYPLDVAWLKVRDVFKFNCAEYKNNPIMASDIVVLQGESIFEKFKDEKEAMDVLKNLSGKEITVSCGIYIYIKTKLGTEFPLYEGVNLTIKLRNFSDSEAGEYIKQQGKEVLNVAGVIDYSKSGAQELIDSSIPVKVEALKLDGYSKDMVLISPKILPDLEDYLKGMPKELLEEMIDRQQALEKI